MSGQFSRTRRFAIAFGALAIAGVLFHQQVAVALVVRGDDYLYRGETAQALERYRRAIVMAPLSQTATDRFVFISMQRNTQASLHAGVLAATHYLSARPEDDVVLSDRALCYLREKRYVQAESDFERAAQVSGAPEAYVFAGWAAQHSGRRYAARALWKKALSVRAGYKPALLALAEHPR